MTDFSSIYEARIQSGDLRPDPEQRTAVAAFEKLEARLKAAKPASPGLFDFLRRSEPTATKGLYLWGGVGRGKSMLMDLFYDHVEVEPRRRVHFHRFMQEIHGAIRRERARGLRDPIKPVATKAASSARLLCFDEMQVGDIADAMILGRLFEAMFAEGVTVVATSNRHPDDLYKDGLNRQLFLPFIEMLKERMAVVSLEGRHDYRLAGALRGDVYLSPLGRETTLEMNGLWRSLTDAAPCAPESLTVHGREIEIPCVAKTKSGALAARASFWDLCGRPLGPADYLAVAERYETVMLEDIPILSAAQANEAKRLVTLIDALYETRRRLILSAEAGPERLYVEGSGAFEFERTVSRLMEMRSEAWLATYA